MYVHEVLAESLKSLQATQEHSIASSEHSGSIKLITDSDSTESETSEESIKMQSAKGGISAKKRKSLERLHVDLVDQVSVAVSGYKRSGRTPDEALKLLYGIMYVRITENLDDQIRHLIRYVDGLVKMKVEPFKSISRDQIKHCANTDELFDLFGFNEAWLNTDNFMDVISAASCPARDTAMYCLKVYRSFMRDVCREVFLANLPETFHEELKAIKPSPFRSSIKVTFKKKLKDFNLTDLLENREYLHRVLKIPLHCFEFLKAESTRSTTVYWEVDAIYTAHAILDVRQGQIFWSLMEKGVIDFHIEGSTHLPLRGRHVPQLIKNALLKGQNLIKLTEVRYACTCRTVLVAWPLSSMYNLLFVTVLYIYTCSDIQPAIPRSSCTRCDRSLP